MYPTPSDIAIKSRFAQIAILLAFALIVLVRIPAILLEGGRFWAEEAVVYFANAWKHPWYISWFVVASDAGYINLAAGLGAWLGLHLGGLAHAPLVTLAAALLIQCLPAYLVLTHKFPWRHSVVATLVAVLLCAIPPYTGEVWLNTITSQFHLALCAALIFGAPPHTRTLFYGDCAILALACLSGPATSFLMPLFVLAALNRRDAQSIVQAAIVLFGFCVQFTVYLLHPTTLRGSHLGLSDLLSVISLHTIVLQFAGVDLARLFSHHLGLVHAAGRFPWGGVACFVLFYGLVGAAISRVRNGVLARLYFAGVVIVLVSFYEAWEVTFISLLHLVESQRYALIPMDINALLVLGLATASRGAWRGLFVVATTVLVLIGSVDYRRGLAVFSHGPPWQPQVAAWHRNPDQVLTVWPGGSWAISLKPNNGRPVAAK